MDLVYKKASHLLFLFEIDNLEFFCTHHILMNEGCTFGGIFDGDRKVRTLRSFLFVMGHSKIPYRLYERGGGKF